MTIAGFPDAENAEQVAALFHLDECHRKKAADNLIDRAIIAERRHLPWLGRVFVGVAIRLSPVLAWMFREGMDGLGNHLIAGFFLVLISAYLTDREQGIIAVTEDGGHIDWWVRRGLFRRIEYRQHLTGESEVSLLRIRFEHRPLLIALLLLGQLPPSIRSAGGMKPPIAPNARKPKPSWNEPMTRMSARVPKSSRAC